MSWRIGMTHIEDCLRGPYIFDLSENGIRASGEQPSTLSVLDIDVV